MYHKSLAECFPFEELPTLYCCGNPQCFYNQTLLNHRESVWKNRWNGEALILVPFCPSCECQLEDYEDPDAQNN